MRTRRLMLGALAAELALIPRAPGTEAVRSTKVSFCLADTNRPRPDLPGSPSTKGYRLSDCPKSRSARRAVTGISVGWEDL